MSARSAKGRLISQSTGKHILRRDYGEEQKGVGRCKLIDEYEQP